MADYSEWLRTTEAAQLLGVSRDRVRQLHYEGKLDGLRTRYGVLINPAAVMALVKARAAQKGAEAQEEASVAALVR